MLKGNKRKKIDYTKFEVNKFVPHIYSSGYQAAGCGSTAISTLTGVNPFSIVNTNKKNFFDFQDPFVVNFLENNNFLVQPLKELEISNHLETFANFITKRHVLLISQRVNKKEATWSIFYNNYIIHNYAISEWTNFEFLNRPIISVFLVVHPSWL